MDMTQRSLSFQFDDLPLVTEGDKTGAEVWGHAEITYLDDGDWYVSGVSFWNRAGYIAIERGTSLFNLIVAALDAPEWRKAIDNAIADDMSERATLRRETAADDWFQRRLEDRA
jgi:hypothetical protein